MEEAIPTDAGLTFEKVWLLMKENEHKFEKWRLEAEKACELDRKEAEEKRELEWREADERFEKRMQEQYEKTNAIIGRLGNRIGDFVEGLVCPGLVRLFNERGIPLGQTAQYLPDPGARARRRWRLIWLASTGMRWWWSRSRAS